MSSCPAASAFPEVEMAVDELWDLQCALPWTAVNQKFQIGFKKWGEKLKLAKVKGALVVGRMNLPFWHV